MGRFTAPALILDAWERGELEVIISPSLYEELREVLHRPGLQRFLSRVPGAVAVLLTGLPEHARWVEPARIEGAVERDPKDNPVIEAAAAGNVDATIFGDRDLLSTAQYQGIPILTPREFLDRLQKPT